MLLRLSMAIILPFFTISTNVPTIGELPLPTGFRRINAAKGSFTDHIRKIRLKKESAVFLYDGRLKPNQQAQFAVLDIPIRNNSLLQCADAVLLIRANWLFNQQQFNQIRFLATDGSWLSYKDWCDGVRYRLKGNKLIAVTLAGEITSPDNRTNLNRFMQVVYSYCGTASLAKQMKIKRDLSKIESGDVFLKGGHPGHVMLVADIAENKNGEKIFILLQGYMPAQDIHVVKAVGSPFIQPWLSYSGGVLQTPEWNFADGSLYQW